MGKKQDKEALSPEVAKGVEKVLETIKWCMENKHLSREERRQHMLDNGDATQEDLDQIDAAKKKMSFEIQRRHWKDASMRTWHNNIEAEA